MRTKLIVGLLLFGWVGAGVAFADATWTGAQSGVWTNPNNWTPATVPNLQTDTATFNTSGTTTVTVTGIQVGTIQFQNTADAFTFGVGSLALYNSGLVNNSASTQTFNVTTVMQFNNSSSAGTNIAINVGSAGNLVFSGTSTADAATIVATGGGKTTFSTGSTAGTANITANSGSSTIFNSTTAASATLNVSGTNSKNVFNGTATAANATINNTNSALTVFNNTSTAASSTITSSSSAKTIFNNSATAGASSITNNAGGSAVFNTSSTASTATITNNSQGTTAFNNNSTAASATITDKANGTTSFNDTTTAGSATINNTANGNLRFFGSATAGNATIANSGTVTFNVTSDGGTATINSTGGKLDISSSAGIGLGALNGTGTVTLGNENLDLGAGNLGSNFSGVISDTGGGSLTKQGTGLVVLSGANTYAGGTTVNAGTLQVGNATALGATTGALAVNGGTLDLNGFSVTVGALSGSPGGTITTSVAGATTLTAGDSTPQTTYSGIIQDGSGTMALVKNGTGTLTLAGANTYSGGTTVNAGALQVGNASALGATTGTLAVDGGTLDLNGFTVTVGSLSGSSGTVTSSVAGTAGLVVNQTTDATYAGVIQDGSGTVSLTKQGDATLNLSGANTYSGGTIIDAGTLQVGNTSALGATTGALTINGGTLDLADNTVTVGNFSGASGAVVTSSVAGSSGLIINQIMDASYDGVIQDGVGTVSLTKQGNAMLTLTGANTYSGDTNVNAGILAVGNASALGLGSVFVNSGGTLQTNGVNRHINVGTNYQQGSGGTLMLGITSASNYDSLHATGTGSLGGTLHVNFANGYTANLGDTFTLVEADGGLGGTTFDTINTTGALPSFLGEKYTYSTDALTLSFFQNMLSQLLGLTPNQQAVATYVDQFTPIVTTGNFGTLVVNLDALAGNTTALGSALDEISPQALQIFDHISFDDATFASQLLNNHLASLRSGLTGFDGSQLTYTDSSLAPLLAQIKGHLLAWDPAPTNGLYSDVVDPLMAGTDTKTCQRGCVVSDVEPADPWSTFIAGNVILADLSHGQDLANQDYTTGSVTMGADYRIDKHWTAGALFGYGHTDADLDDLGSTATVDTYSPGIYASYVDGGWYGNGLFSYGYNSYTEDRNIQIGTLNGINHGAPQGSQFVGDLTGGYDFKEGAWTIGPVGSVQYVNLGINSFQEQGPTALNIQSQSAESFRSQFGFSTSYMGHVSGWFGSFGLSPHLSATWQHEFLDDSRGITSQFNQIGAGSFTVSTVNPDRDSALIDVGVDAIIDNNITLFADYATEAGEDDFFAQSIQAGLKIEF
jgi:autotransporter-associated beta strand protein